MQLKLSSDHKASPLKEIINIFFSLFFCSFVYVSSYLDTIQMILGTIIWPFQLIKKIIPDWLTKYLVYNKLIKDFFWSWAAAAAAGRHKISLWIFLCCLSCATAAAWCFHVWLSSCLLYLKAEHTNHKTHCLLTYRVFEQVFDTLF